MKTLLKNHELIEIANEINTHCKYNRHLHPKYTEFCELLKSEEFFQQWKPIKAMKFIVFAKPCLYCGKLEILTTVGACSKECSVKIRYESKRIERHRIADEKRKSEGGIQCKICGEHIHTLPWHLKKHKISIEEYEEQFGVGPRFSEKWLANNKTYCWQKGEANPAYQHGGKFSPFSKNSIYHSAEVREAANEKRKQTTKENPQNQSTRIEFWLTQGLSEEEAKEALSERQTTFSLEKCIEKFGEIEGRVVWQARQEKWMKSFKKSNYSKVSQELFFSIMLNYNGNVYFAEYDRPEKSEYTNKEYILKTAASYVRPDFIDIDKRKIIEFDGDYWHRNNTANPSREAQRDNEIIEMGYEILHVKESDYKSNKEKVIEECRNFLTK